MIDKAVNTPIERPFHPLSEIAMFYSLRAENRIKEENIRVNLA
jgi:hypothetical protein